MDHYIEKCRGCKITIGQCRCPSSDKVIKWSVCEKCKAAGVGLGPQEKFIGEVPKEAGKIVSTCVFKDQYFVACEYAVFVLGDGKMQQIQFVPARQE